MQFNAVPRRVKLEHLPKKAIRGAVLFQSAGCTACHTYARTGSRNLGETRLRRLAIFLEASKGIR